ncbi:hypothetical protein AAIB41_07415 [Brucella sp. BE17]|uniref:hypothetical protein n=1 Tax=Brucella sp. BE17 TaxID=3142977 RepID=UPI0031BB77C8
MRHLKKPILAIILAIIPFFVFLGSQKTVQINGALTTDSRFNILGVILGVIAIGMAISVLRSSSSDNTMRMGLGAAAGILGVVQIAAAFDLVRIDPWEWINPDRNLPVLKYAGPGVNMDGKVFVTTQTAEGYKNAVWSKKVDLIRLTQFHMGYADHCHAGRYRVNTEVALAIPDYFTKEESGEILAEAEKRKLSTAQECNPKNASVAMGRTVDEINSNIDAMDAFERKYKQLAGI